MRRGFSGAAVIDDLTDTVIGMVVTAHTDEAERLSRMIPVETLVRYIGRSRTGLARTCPRCRPRSHVVVIGGPVAKGLDPPRGTIKVTVNVTGRTTDEVHERIEGRLSSARSESEPSTDSAKGTSQPVTVALTGIDESSQPEALLHTVVKPLVDAGTEMELRFSDESSPGLGLAQQWLREEISSRLATLTTRVEEIDAAETALRARRSDIATRVSPVPDIPSTTRIWGSGSVPSGARGSIRRGSVPRWPRPSARPSGPPALSNG